MVIISIQNIGKIEKKKLPPISSELREIAIGMILSDACMYKKSNHSLIKFEQGYAQEEFLNHLFSLFKSYCFMGVNE